jgi:arylsulfatase A-like enzyme
MGPGKIIMELVKKTLLLIGVFGLLHAQAQKKPNIIMVMTDDLGWFDVGFNGNTNIKTPHLDNMAKSGIILDRFYSASAVCSPTRASCITGRNPNRMGIPHANTGHLKPEEITIPELLKKEGYVTGHFGKWHLGILTKKTIDANRGGREQHFEHYSIPTEHGYDMYFCTESKVPTYDPMIFPASFQSHESKRYGWNAVSEMDEVKNYGTSYWKGVEESETENLNGDDSKIIMDRVIPFITDAVNKGNPFFTTIWFHTPHLPVVSDKEHCDLYEGLSKEEQIYFGTISAMDDQMGRLWKHLEDQGQADNTMIWFCSDNGPEDNTPGSAGAFRERKRSLHEGGVRVPAFIVWNAALEGGKRIDFPMVTSDYLPTIIDFMEIEYPDERPMDGKSVKGALLGEEKQRNQAIGFMFSNQISWVSDEYKLISKDKGESFELYDLNKDKSEKLDIKEEHSEMVADMMQSLEVWLKSVRNSNNGSDYQ